MSLEELQQKRLKWVEASRENHFEDGIKHFLTALYPDNAHFIYELLQNAEDAQATEVRFTLKVDRIEFEHDGSRLFSMEDVDAITSIGDSHKTDDPTNIGEFGVGFKAVFAYTSTPEVQSGAYHFRIRDLVVPDTEGLPVTPAEVLYEKRTRFVLPFDNPDKPEIKARAEIESNLRTLDENTLLFLSNIRRIEYILPDLSFGFLERIESQGNLTEVLVKTPDNTEPITNTYLRIMKDVKVTDEDGKSTRCRIATAYGLEHTQGQEWKIKLVDEGKVCIYFPALKEQSNLHFHLHAPFASTVARDSVRDCEANETLRDELSQLIAESMSVLRDQGLLKLEFLAILPNMNDNLSAFYVPILKGLTTTYQNEELVPMKRGGHAAARNVFKGSTKLSNIVTDYDLAMIQGGDASRPMWIANPPQRNERAVNFLSMLDISKWSPRDLVDVLTKEIERMAGWLSGKNLEWHQGLYSILGEYLVGLQKQPKSHWDPQIRAYRNKEPNYEDTKRSLSEVPIIRLSDGTYKRGKDCFFPSDGVEYDEDFPRVTSGVFMYGDDTSQQHEARKFLADIGVKELDESHRVEAILKERYCEEDAGLVDRDRYLKDLRRFASLVKNDPDQSDLFKQYRVFWSQDEKWRTPVELYVDLPALDTGLSAYFDAPSDEQPRKWALSQFFEACDLEIETLREFAESIGVQAGLTIEKQKIPWGHPERRELEDFSNTRRTNTGTDDDFNIEELEFLLERITIGKAKLIWRTMCILPDECLYARYCPNQQYEEKVRASSLVHSLRTAEWIPQENENGYNFSFPRDARVEFLPQGFQYERGIKWLEAIEFGNKSSSAVGNSLPTERVASELGTDEDGIKRVEEFLGWPSEIQEEILDAMRQKESSQSFPEHESSNRARRDAKIVEHAKSAPDRSTEDRSRSVSVARDAVKSETEPYLRSLYTENDNLFCQICRCSMPFRLKDGKHYFEMIEFLELKKRHYQNYLALCPNHAAMFQHANPSKGSEVERINKLGPGEVELCIELAGEKAVVVFTPTHIEDLKALINFEELGQTDFYIRSN